MSNGHAAYTLLPFVRQGIGALVSAAGIGEVQLAIRGGANISLPLALHGPGDVASIDPRAVIRAEPRPFATDFESTYMPAVEFDRPDFPWLFSPPSEPDQPLLPWICLIVLRRERGTALKPSIGEALPSVTCAQGELPDLAESWAWAHAQVLRDGDTIEGVLTAAPSRNLSRLLCPRRLEENAAYIACVVPTYKAGVQSGLGEAVQAGARDLAWTGDGGDVTLPVYYHWEFRTGPAGDFESLARRIQPRDLPSGVGRRDVDLTDPGFGLPNGGVVALEGVLRPARPRPVDGRHLRAFQKTLEKLVNEPARRARGRRRDVPVVSPPLYGQWHAGREAIEPETPAWLGELNRDPRYRIAASFGALVVQRDQEQLVAAAWDQLGELQRANQLLRQAQLAREVSSAIHRRQLASLRVETLFRVAAPVMSRVVRDATRRTFQADVRESALPVAALGAAFRRVTRPRGPIARRMPTHTGLPLLRRLASKPAWSPAERRTPGGMLTIDAAAALAREVGGAVAGPRFGELTAEGIRTRASRRPPAPSRRPTRGTARAAEVPAALRDALARQYAFLRTAAAAPEAAPAAALPLDDLAPQLRDRLRPDRTIPTRVRDRLGPNAAPPSAVDDPLEPVMARPDFAQPMFEPLRALSPDLVLPGLEDVPRDAVLIMEINRPFVEAYMAGLNHEFARELLWREFPTDQRGTYFRQFWNTTRPAVGDAGPDIRPLDAWTAALGDNFAGADPPSVLVLVIRAELLMRHPSAVISMCHATRVDGRWMPAGETRQPLFRSPIDPDVVFLGFAITLDEALGRTDADGAGWYFVIQEQPTEPRFGFETASGAADAATADTWQDVAWPHLTDDHVSSSGYVTVRGPLAGSDKHGIAWGRDGAHMACVAFQYPFRIALHARLLLEMQAQR